MPTKFIPRAASTKYRVYTWDNSTLIGQEDGGTIGSWFDSLTGDTLPNWKLLISLGQNATTAASSSKVDYRPGTGVAEVEYWLISGPFKTRRLVRASGALLGGNTPFPSNNLGLYDANAADSQARLKFLGNYRQMRTAFQGGTFFGEIAETLRMLKSPAHALRQSIDKYFRTVTKRARRTSRGRQNAVVRETYLEYSFGWKPLINDINDIAKLVSGANDTYLKEIEATATVPMESISSKVQSGMSSMTIWFNYKTLGQVMVRYKGAVSASFEKPPSLAEFTGFGLSNFVPTIWNLIPYSFLVDYFTNIGNVIDAASLGSVRLAWGCRSERKSFQYQLGAGDSPFTNTPTTILIHKSVNLSGFHSEQSASTRSRVTSVSAGIADTQFRIPGVDQPWKWLNIGALASLRQLPFLR